jgi:uncharacterized protein with NRDE domain
VRDVDSDMMHELPPPHARDLRAIDSRAPGEFGRRAPDQCADPLGLATRQVDGRSEQGAPDRCGARCGLRRSEPGVYNFVEYRHLIKDSERWKITSKSYTPFRRGKQMCVLAFAWHAHPRWPLVVAGNRDELHARPAAPLYRWDQEGLIAGRDLQSGGTWLGVSEAGRFAVVTNLHGFGPPAPERTSRGALVTGILTGAAADPLNVALDAYNPFNLIAAGPTQAWFLTNRPKPSRISLEPGIYGLSNGQLDEPWPKTERLKSVLADWVAGGEHEPERLLDALGERTLPDVGLRAESRDSSLSPIFTLDPIYGTRCSTVVAIDGAGGGRIMERRYTARGMVTGETSMDFSWPEQPA